MIFWNSINFRYQKFAGRTPYRWGVPTIVTKIINPFFLDANATVSGSVCHLPGTRDNWMGETMPARIMDYISSTHVVVGGNKVVESGRMARSELLELDDRSSCDLMIVTNWTKQRERDNRYSADLEPVKVTFDIP